MELMVAFRCLLSRPATVLGVYTGFLKLFLSSEMVKTTIGNVRSVSALRILNKFPYPAYAFWNPWTAKNVNNDSAALRYTRRIVAIRKRKMREWDGHP